jgi:hypothetical protein
MLVTAVVRRVEHRSLLQFTQNCKKWSFRFLEIAFLNGSIRTYGDGHNWPEEIEVVGNSEEAMLRI